MHQGSWPRAVLPFLLGSSIARCNALALRDTARVATQSPVVFSLGVDRIREISDYVLAQDQAVFNNILSTVTPETATFNNTLAPWSRHQDEVAGLITAFNYIADPIAYNATNDFFAARSPFLANVTNSEEYWPLVKAVYDNLANENKLWTPEGRLATMFHQSRVDAGLSIPKGPDRDRYSTLVQEQQNLTRAFNANTQQPAAPPNLFFSREELEGVDPQLLATFTNGTGADAGKLGIDVLAQASAVIPIAKNQRVRQELAIGYNRLARDNVDILKQAYAGRDEMAQLLGYPNYAAARLQDTIAGSPENALALINEIGDTLKPSAADSVDQLNIIVKRDNSTASAYRWDIEYARIAIDEAQTNLTDDNFGSYFVPTFTVPTALQLFGQALGFDLQLVHGSELDALSPTGKGADILPAPQASLYEVRNSGSNDFAGYFYTDILARPGKISNSTQGTAIQRAHVSVNGTRTYPSVILNGGYYPTQHLSAEALANLFWQIGVAYWHLSCESEFGDLCGDAGAPTDFSQMPGQMMENFGFNPIVLQKVSRHWSYFSPNDTASWKQAHANSTQPPETLPFKTAKKAEQSKLTFKTLDTLYKVWYSLYDLQTHMPSSREAAKDLPITQIYNQLAVDACLVPWGESLPLQRLANGSPNYEWAWGQATYPDWMNYWYGRWYSWTWAKVYSEDVYYAKFANDPFNAENWREYRRKVLARAGDPKQFVADFLGREPNTGAFYHDVGII
ncbi:hypothetical protein CBER1_04817 [Cercospora berteroae]|uniref:Peptidase M3A/M3B catalytic domain-containing protein n=1 Tax=Cercospora berteroae TaxID=357750 RepID=A0A2S6BRL1_9PEZI|nr:hypothetical protein CBER1_04817 [Cercospora berteroae]